MSAKLKLLIKIANISPIDIQSISIVKKTATDHLSIFLTKHIKQL